MVNAIRKGTRIVEALAADGPKGVSALAEDLDLPKSTLHRYLTTMEEEGLLVSQEGEYRVALRFLDIGERVRQQKDLLSIAKTELDDLTEEIDHPAHLVVEENDQAVYLYESDHTRSFRTSVTPGKHVPLHRSAAGRVILAEHDSEEVPPMNGEPEDSSEVILTRGYASTVNADSGEIGEIAAPIRDTDDIIQAAIGITVDEESLDEAIEDIVDQVQQTARIIEIKADYT